MVQFMESREDRRDEIMISKTAEAGLDPEAPDLRCPDYYMLIFSPQTPAPYFSVICEVLVPAMFRKKGDEGDLGSREKRK